MIAGNKKSLRGRRVLCLALSFTLCLVVMVALLALVNDPARAWGSTLYVAPDGDCGGASPCHATIQGAVDAASHGDIVKVAQGVYTGAGFQVVYISRPITVTGGYTITDWVNSRPDLQPTVLDAEDVERRRVVHIHEASMGQVILDGLTMRRGNIAGDSGGGVYVSATGIMIIENCWIQDNHAGSGAGLYILTGTVTVRDCQVLDNSGGGVRSEAANLLVESSTFRGNTGDGVQMISGTATITGSTFESNSEGAGIRTFCDSTVTADHNTIIQNAGTGIVVGRNPEGMCKIVTISHNLISRNKTGVSILSGNTILDGNTVSEHKAGGVIVETDNWWGYAGVVRITNNLIQGNSNEQGGGGWPDYNEGGGLYVSKSDAVVANNIIRDNLSVRYGGGMYLEGHGYDEYVFSIAARDNVIYNNSAQQGGGAFIRAGIVTLEHSFIVSNTATVNGGGLALTGGSDRLPVALEGNTIVSNTAPYGGGLALVGFSDSYVLAQNDVIANNSPMDGVYVSGGTLFARHWTLAGNGNYALSTDSGGTTFFTNTIVASHTLAGLWGMGVKADNTLFFNSGVPCGGGASCTSNLFGDPDFVNPIARDYHIGPDSSAIDAGIDAGVLHDMDHQPRLGIPDLGADEYWAPGALRYAYLPMILKNYP